MAKGAGIAIGSGTVITKTVVNKDASTRGTIAAVANGADILMAGIRCSGATRGLSKKLSGSCVVKKDS